MGRQKWNRAKMEALISRYESSGLTQKKFCELEQLRKSTFEYWHRKLRAKSEEKPAGFQQIIAPKKEPIEQIRLLLSKGITLEFPATYPPAQLLKIIHGISC